MAFLVEVCSQMELTRGEKYFFFNLLQKVIVFSNDALIKNTEYR